MPLAAMVTGAGGFLGSHIADHFEAQRHDVTAVGRFSLEHSGARQRCRNIVGMTLPDRRFVDAVRACQPDVLVHCAGTASVPESVARPYTDFQRTVDVCAFVLETLRTEAPGCHFVLLSSAAVYGNPEALPIGEATPTKPVSPYGYHKMLCELLAREAAELHGIRTATVRIFSAYGPRQRKQVVFDLFEKFCRPGDEPVQILGTGEETRDFIHAADVASAIDAIVQAGATGLFNVASGHETSISLLAHVIRDTLGSHKEIDFTGNRRAGDPLQWRADVGRLQALGAKPALSLTEGLKDFAAWFSADKDRKRL